MISSRLKRSSVLDTQMIPFDIALAPLHVDSNALDINDHSSSRSDPESSSFVAPAYCINGLIVRTFASCAPFTATVCATALSDHNKSHRITKSASSFTSPPSSVPERAAPGLCDLLIWQRTVPPSALYKPLPPRPSFLLPHTGVAVTAASPGYQTAPDQARLLYELQRERCGRHTFHQCNSVAQ